MDWTFVPTTLTLYEWIKFEEILSALYERRVELTSLHWYPRKVGERQKKLTKFLQVRRRTAKSSACRYCGWRRILAALQGALSFSGILLVLWAPILLASFATSVARTEVPVIRVTMDVQIRLPNIPRTYDLFRRALHRTTPHRIRTADVSLGFSSCRHFVRCACSLSNSQIVPLPCDGQNDVELGEQRSCDFTWQQVSMVRNSDRVWSISPPARELLLGALGEHNATADILVAFSLERNEPVTAGAYESHLHLDLPQITLDPNQTIKLHDLLTPGGDDSLGLELPMVPSVLKLSAKTAQIAALVSRAECEQNPFCFMQNASVLINRTLPPSYVEWFALLPMPNSTAAYSGPTFTLASAFVASGFISSVLQYGIIGLYVTFVLVVHRILRASFLGIVQNISQEDFPSTDRLWTLCQDLLAARHGEQLELEEQLYRSLIHIFRSTELLIEWSQDADATDENKPKMS